jgi:hypothetical protein
MEVGQGDGGAVAMSELAFGSDQGQRHRAHDRIGELLPRIRVIALCASAAAAAYSWRRKRTAAPSASTLASSSTSSSCRVEAASASSRRAELQQGRGS